MPITQQRMTNLITAAAEFRDHLELLRDIAATYNTDDRLDEARIIARTAEPTRENLTKVYELLRATLGDLIDRVSHDHVRDSSLSIIAEEAAHFKRVAKLNEASAKRIRLRRYQRKLPNGAAHDELYSDTEAFLDDLSAAK